MIDAKGTHKLNKIIFMYQRQINCICCTSCFIISGKSINKRGLDLGTKTKIKKSRRKSYEIKTENNDCYTARRLFPAEWLCNNFR